MEIPGLGPVSKDDEFDWYRSKPVNVAAFGRSRREIVVEGYDDDTRKEEFHTAIKNFLSAGDELMHAAEPYVYRYCQDLVAAWLQEDGVVMDIKRENLWNHVDLDRLAVYIRRRGYGDKRVYVSLECNCDWEPEHGLEIVYREGRELVKVGPYDGHMTNTDAYDDEKLEGVIYTSAHGSL